MSLAMLQIALLAMLGCSAQTADALASEYNTNCAVDTDCEGDQICRVGLCSVRAVSASTLSFRFIPPGDSNFLPQYHESVRVRPGESTDFLLRPALSVRSGEAAAPGEHPGGIRYVDAPRRGPEGTLIFRPINARNSLFIRESHVDDGTFHARVNPGAYSLTFIPNDRELLPKKTWAAQEFTSNTILLRTLLSPSDYIVISGTLSRDVALPGGQSVPGRQVSNARVYALSADGEHSSTVATTDEFGDFTLKVEPNTGSYDIFVVPESSDAMIPSVEFREAFRAEATHCVTAIGGEGNPCSVGVLSLGAYPTEPSQVSVQLVAPSDFQQDFSWQGTMVVVRGALGAGEFEHKYPVDADGMVEMAIFPSNWSLAELRPYTLEIIPPADSPFARTQLTIGGPIDNGMLPSLELELKQRLTGQVLSADGSPMAGATLEFRRTSGPISESSSDSDSTSDEIPPYDPRTVSVTTDDTAQFEVWLLHSAYSVEIIPPDNSGQPRMTTSLGAEAIRDGAPLAFELPEPMVLLGSVFGADGAKAEGLDGIGDVGVEAYKTIDGRTVVLGQTRSNADGEFRMVVSAEL
jgi:hypothetical protein